MSSELVRQVASLLDEENEEALKGLLKKSFEIDYAAVSAAHLHSMVAFTSHHLCRGQ